MPEDSKIIFIAFAVNPDLVIYKNTHVRLDCETTQRSEFPVTGLLAFCIFLYFYILLTYILHKFNFGVGVLPSGSVSVMIGSLHSAYWFVVFVMSLIDKKDAVAEAWTNNLSHSLML